MSARDLSDSSRQALVNRTRTGGHWRNRTRGDTLTFIAFLLPATVLISMFLIYPILLVFATSFTNLQRVTDDAHFIGFTNFSWVLNNPYFQRSTLNTFIFTSLAMAGVTVLGILIAIVVNQENLPGRAFFRTVMLFSWIIPELVAAVVMRVIFDSNIGIMNHWLAGLGLAPAGWLNDPNLSLYTLILISVWKGLPFNILIYLTALQAIDKDFYEASAIDGATAWQNLRFVTLPSIRPTIETTVILGTVWTTNVFFLPFILTRGGPLNSTTMWSLSIYDLSFGAISGTTQIGRAQAMAVITFLTLFAFGVIYLRVFRIRSESA